MKIHLIQRQITLDFDNQTSLLNFLEQHHIHHEYQCRSGYCGSCRVKIKKGKVSYAEAPLAFIQPDEILLCCCRVESDIELDLWLSDKMNFSLFLGAIKTKILRCFF